VSQVEQGLLTVPKLRQAGEAVERLGFLACKGAPKLLNERLQAQSAKLFSRAWAVPDGTRNSEKSVCHIKHAPRKVVEMMEMMMMMMLKVTRCVTLVRGGSGWKLVVYSWMWLMKVVMVVVVMVVMVVVVVVGGCD
jgi:hypothetical protein